MEWRLINRILDTVNFTIKKEGINILPLNITFIYHHSKIFSKLIMTDILLELLKILTRYNPLKIMLLFLASCGIYLISLKVITGKDLNPYLSDNFFLVLILVGLALVALSAIRYLDSAADENENIEKNFSGDIESIISSRVKTIMEDIQRDTTASISEEEKDALLKDLRNQFEAKISEEYYQDITQKIKNEWLESEIDFSVSTITSRLKNEIKTLKLRSNLNLVIGMILCFSGIIALYIFLQKNAGMYVISFKNHNINEIILTLIPNAFFVLLIEIFSYFFLNLYKKSIEEIKFYQNELTNLESKFLALKTAKITKNHKLQCIILEEIVKTERNFILQPGHSTIEIEKEKISSTNSSNVLKAATDLLNFKK